IVRINRLAEAVLCAAVRRFSLEDLFETRLARLIEALCLAQGTRGQVEAFLLRLDGITRMRQPLVEVTQLGRRLMFNRSQTGIGDATLGQLGFQASSVGETVKNVPLCDGTDRPSLELVAGVIVGAAETVTCVGFERGKIPPDERALLRLAHLDCGFGRFEIRSLGERP